MKRAMILFELTSITRDQFHSSCYKINRDKKITIFFPFLSKDGIEQIRDKAAGSTF